MTDEHVVEAVRPWLSEPVEKRISLAEQDRWFEVSTVGPVLRMAQRLVHQPDRLRPRCMLVAARSGMGKTALVHELIRRFPLKQDGKNGVTAIPVLHCELEPPAHPNKLYAAVGNALGLPLDTVQPKDVPSIIKLQLKEFDVRAIAIDELGLLAHSNIKVARDCCNILKWLGNVTQRPIIGLGTPEIVPIFSRDTQLSSRFRRWEIPIWTIGTALQSFVKTQLMHLPLREPWEPEILERPGLSLLVKNSDGTTNGIVEILRNAAVDILSEGRERLCLEDIEAAVW